MTDLNRRSALAAGLAAAILPAVGVPVAAIAGHGYPKGHRVAAGVRQIDLGTRQTSLSAYRALSMHDLVYQPGAATWSATRPTDAICQAVEGALRIQLGDETFDVAPGDIWSCPQGVAEKFANIGSGRGVVRVIDLHFT